ncbi:MAG: isochorismatase family protein [Planctomycetaceae bacterium]|jgi:nicotinamidase-related amidase|nr:isochorismatase family protein [Planctomycetaceae bacterium]
MTELKLDADNLALVLIDIQAAFVDQMIGPREPVLVRLEQLLIVAQWLQLPLLTTLEEPVARKGMLLPRLQEKFPEHGQVYHKQTYDLCGEPDILLALKQLQRKQLVVAGTETDVCILQSVLGLLDQEYQVFILEDCLFSSAVDTDPAIYRMRQAGAIPLTYKSLHYELLQTEDNAAWREGHQAAVDAGLRPVESLPAHDESEA